MRKRGGARRGERQPTDIEGNPAEIVVKIVGLDAPVRREQPFEAATSRPARTGLRETSESGRKAKDAGREGRRNVTALVTPAVSETAVSIDQQGRRHQVAETAAHGAEIIDRVINRYVRLRLRCAGRESSNRHYPNCAGRASSPRAGRESSNRHYPNCAGRASSPRALYVRFDADEPGVSELKVVADLTAADKSGIVQG